LDPNADRPKPFIYYMPLRRMALIQQRHRAILCLE
jgi:hypothetical protein